MCQSETFVNSITEYTVSRIRQIDGDSQASSQEHLDGY